MSNHATASVFIVDPTQSSKGTESTPGRLWASARTSDSKKALDSRVLYNAAPEHPVAALVSVGDGWGKKDANTQRELVRKAAGAGVGKVKDVSLSAGIRSVEVDGSLDAHAAGEWGFGSGCIVY